MRILVCNDDGADAPGIDMLARAAHALTSDVWVVAPKRKWTAASHQLSFDRDLELTRIRDRVHACSGAPADCVVAAMAVLFRDEPKPDLVLSGINDKANVGEDLAYSGTTAIAREAVFWDVPAIALSRAGHARESPGDTAVVARLLAHLWRRRADWAHGGHWLGVNLPARLPAPLAPARLAHDKIGAQCDIVSASDERIVYRLRRGRPGTAMRGDENERLAAGMITVKRFDWHADAPLPDTLVEGWQP